jgi:hypothetical protein
MLIVSHLRFSALMVVCCDGQAIDSEEAWEAAAKAGKQAHSSVPVAAIAVPVVVAGEQWPAYLQKSS